MSEAELHVIRARLQGGILSKARRGELRVRLPVGFDYDEEGKLVLHPDKQVRKTIRLFFETFERVGSAHATVKAFREQGLEFPFRMHFGPQKGEILWRGLSNTRAVEILHNPRYAGAFVYGRRRQRRRGLEGGMTLESLPREQWRVLLRGAHEGYISWEKYENNQKRIEANALGRRKGRKTPPREGPALLQGLAICGKCGGRMTVRYHHRRGALLPEYICCGAGNVRAEPTCQSIPGTSIDEAVGRLLLEALTPLSVEVAMAVQSEVESKIEQTDEIRRQSVERARHEVDLSRRRFMKVVPENRLVLDELESEWNAKLRRLKEVQEDYERRRQADRLRLDAEAKRRLDRLPIEFPRIWKDPKTPSRERKRMVHLLIEDVTLNKDGCIRLHVRFRGGARRSLSLPRPRCCWEQKQTSVDVLVVIDRLLEEHTYGEIAKILNERGDVSGTGKRFDARRVKVTARAYGLKSRYTRLRQRGWLTLEETAAKLGVCKATVKRRRFLGTLSMRAAKLNDAGVYMYREEEVAQGLEAADVSTRSEEV